MLVYVQVFCQCPYIHVSRISNQIQIELLNNWASCNKSTTIFPHMTQPNMHDPINSLGRKEQVIIYQLHSQHAPEQNKF